MSKRIREEMLCSRIIQLTIPSGDNGKRFILTERLDLIRSTLANSQYDRFADLPLAKIYRHQDFHPQKPFLLVSCHIDSLYGEYYAIKKDGELQGTFDNSACDAVLIEAMVRSRFSPQVLITFTGDEEDDSKGVDQTIRRLKKQAILSNLEMVIVLDLTEEHYGYSHFTVENYFAAKKNRRALLCFSRKRELKAYLAGMIESPVFVKDAGADEAWQYDEHDVNCFSLCLPCRLLGDDMHDNIGVAISEQSLAAYMGTLENLTRNIDDDLRNKALQRIRN